MHCVFPHFSICVPKLQYLCSHTQYLFSHTSVFVFPHSVFVFPYFSICVPTLQYLCSHTQYLCSHTSVFVFPHFSICVPTLSICVKGQNSIKFCLHFMLCATLRKLTQWNYRLIRTKTIEEASALKNIKISRKPVHL